MRVATLTAAIEICEDDVIISSINFISGELADVDVDDVVADDA